MDFQQAQAIYGSLRQKLVNRQISQQQFAQEVDKLRFQTPDGVWWAIRREDGVWLRWESGAWKVFTPAAPSAQAGGQAAASISQSRPTVKDSPQPERRNSQPTVLDAPLRRGGVTVAATTAPLAGLILRTTRGVNPSERFPIPFAREVRLGKNPENDVVLRDPTVSRFHAKILLTAKGCELTDLGSTNGTFVNQKRINGPVMLRLDDMLTLGNIDLRVEVG